MELVTSLARRSPCSRAFRSKCAILVSRPPCVCVPQRAFLVSRDTVMRILDLYLGQASPSAREVRMLSARMRCVAQVIDDAVELLCNQGEIFSSSGIVYLQPEYLRNAASDSGAVVDYEHWQMPLGRWPNQTLTRNV